MHFFLEFELKQKKQIRKGKEKKEEGHTCCRPGQNKRSPFFFLLAAACN
jgi:hypothetical protein